MELNYIIYNKANVSDLDQVITLRDENEAEIKIEFLSSTEREQISKCNKVETDVTFEIHTNQSSPLSKITYFNLHNHVTESFEFRDNSKMRLKFDGFTLTCDSDESKCKPLENGEQTPVVLLSFYFKPQNGYKPSWQTLDSNLNKFSIRGSHYSITCAGIFKIF